MEGVADRVMEVSSIIEGIFNIVFKKKKKEFLIFNASYINFINKLEKKELKVPDTSYCI